MTRSPVPALRRSTLTLLVVSAMTAAFMTVAVAQDAEAATPTCFGKKATMVGTRGNDTIRGTKRADVIVAKGGNDLINGRGGADLICAGGGADTVNGGPANDRISGSTGADVLNGDTGNDVLRGDDANDVLRGGDGDDVLNGGPAIDACYQDAGTGAMSACETADLAVEVAAPPDVDPAGGSHMVTFTVMVTNNGPSAVPYTLTLSQSSQKATCEPAAWAGSHAQALLASGATRSTDYVATCTKEASGAKARLAASVSTFVPDPVADNDAAERQANLK